MNKIIAMWSHPRSMSTAVERLMHSRGDLECLHEPFMYYYYLDQSNRDMPYFDPDVDHAVTYEGVKQMILSKANISPVFFKDMSYYVTSELEDDTEFNQQMTHCFLIRNPMASIASYYALDNNLTLKEIGIEAQWRQYEHLVEMGIKPVVIKAESVRQNPQAYAAHWWDSIGLDYKAKAFDWNEEYPASWESVKTWHGSVISSSSIRALDEDDELKQQQRFGRAVASEPRLQHYLDHHLPFYDRLNAVAL